MDVSISKRPLAPGGVQWSNANRCIIATPERVFIVTPQHTLENEIPKKREVSASIESEVDIEAVALADDLPEEFGFSHAVIALAGDSSIRVLASPINPDTLVWTQVARHQLGTGADHVVSISSCVVGGAGAQGMPVIACASVGGTVEIFRLVAGQRDEATGSGDLVALESLARVAASPTTVAHMGWLAGDGCLGADSQDQQLLATCSVDGTASIWKLTHGARQCREAATVGNRDWSAFTAHAASGDIAVLAKIGLAAIVDIRAEATFETQYVELGMSQTIVCCAVDERRERVYIGTLDFAWFVLAQRRGRWVRVAEEEGAFRDGVRATIVGSFTTKFNMNQLFLRGMTMSPNGRYLSFIAE
ncbi:hypothetical protein LPJ75_003963 [Coemansia sp. RSA 2598]|nr:hypothetical protein LPJ75_003963 [Coemansia sp. RSA 2598]